MICLYSKTNTNYNTNGDAVLNPISAQLQLTLNGAWILTLSHPYDQEEKWKLLEEGATIQAPITCIRELSTTLQRFKIYQRQKNMHDVSVIAFPEGMEATFDTPVDNLVITNKTAAQTIDLLQPFCNNKYTLYTNLTTNGSTSWANTNIFSAIAGSGENTFLKTWGGELIFDNKTFKILSRVGDTTAANHKITYGHNLSAIDYDKDDSGVTTRIYPISQDGIRLNGAGYVDSPNHFSDYPVAHCRHMTAPYYLVDTNPGNNTATAIATQQVTAAIATQAETLGRSSYATAIDGGFQPEYIKQQRDAIIAAVKAQALSGVVSASMYAAFEKAIESGLSFLASVQQPAWGWMGSAEQGWKYGDANGYATNQYIRISRKWSYFGSDGNWQEPRDDSEEWDWYQGSSGTGKKYGNFKKYYAHNEFVYITEDNQMKEYWFNEQGWYESDESGDSDWDWHGSGTAEDPWWFGEEGASAGDTRKYAHDCWLFIDGTLYFFDSYGYYDGSTKFEYYQWDWVEDDERWWFGNAIDKTYAATYLTNQWAKIDGDWYYFDANGYAEQTNASIARVVAVFTTGMTELTSTISTNKSTLYTLLYDQMSAWALKQYTQGIDLPVITITVNMVDLSKTQDYQGFADLETVKLGDSVAVTDAEHGISTTNRVIGLTYDLINDYNAEVIIGSATASVASMISGAAGQAVAGGFDSSAIETQLNTQATAIAQLRQNKQDKLNAGNLINLSGSTISADIEANPGTAGTTDLQKIRLGNTIFNLPSGGAGLQYWHETASRFYREGVHEGTSGLEDYLKLSTNQIGWYMSGQGWSRCCVVKLKGNLKQVIMGYSSHANGVHPLICFASPQPLDFEWSWSDNTLSPPYGVTEWQDKSTYPVPTEGYDQYFGYGTATTTYEGTTWYILAVDCLYWDGGDGVDSTDGISTFSWGKWTNKPDISLVGYDLLEVAHAAPYTEVVTEIGTENYAFKYGNDYTDITHIDTDGNALFKEITTDAGTLTQQMARKQNLLTAGANVEINGDIISATDTKYNDFTGATAQEAGTAGLVPAPETTESDKFLKGDGTWATPSGGTEVEANPTEAATATLQKLKVDGTVYGVSGGGGGSFVGLTKSEYEALPAAEKENTSKLYFVQEGGGLPVIEDLIQTASDWSIYREGSMTINWASDTIVFDWLGGTSIGGNIVKTVPIPASASKIKFKITTGNSYSDTIDRFRVFIGVRTTYQTGVILPYYSINDWIVKSDYYTRNSVWESELDLSGVAVDTYLYITAHGWDATVDYLQLETPSAETVTRHTYWNDAKWAQWNPVKELLQNEYDQLTTEEKQNGSIYMIYSNDNYDYINYDNGKIIIRIDNNTGQILWFFNGFTKDSADFTVPAALVPYLPDHTTQTQVIQAKAWTDATSATTNGWVGFVYPGTANVKIQSWSTNFNQLIAGTFWAVLDIDGSSAEGGQIEPYYSPYAGTASPNKIYFNNKLFADSKKSNTISYGTAAPTEAGNDGDLFILLDNNNNKIGEYLFITNAWVQIE